jgi:hypothetical protein
MPTYKYEGKDTRVFPTIKKIVKPGETFEAPEKFSANDVKLVSDIKKPSAPAVEPIKPVIQPSEKDETAGE